MGGQREKTPRGEEDSKEEGAAGIAEPKAKKARGGQGAEQLSLAIQVGLGLGTGVVGGSELIDSIDRSVGVILQLTRGLKCGHDNTHSRPCRASPL